MHVRTWQVAYADVLPAARLRDITVESRTERWRRLLDAQPATERTAVAELDGDVVGFVSTGPAREDERRGELYAIYVHPDVWGTGSGRALMASALEHLRAEGFADAILWVLEDNPRARRFYERAGWSADGGAKLETVLGVDAPHVRYAIELAEEAGSTAAE